MGTNRKDEVMNEEVRIQRDTQDTHDSDVLPESPSEAAAAPAREVTPESRTAEPFRSRTTSREPEPIMPLFSGDQSQALRSRWEALQVSFVDEPRHAVEEADRLVGEAINSLSRGFATEREKLEQQWHRGESASTEDLRLALRRYRSFFERLLSI
jgi:hypothetical protein